MNAITATRRTIRREWTAFGTLLIISVGLMGVSGTQTAHDFESAVNWAVEPGGDCPQQRRRHGRLVLVGPDPDRPAANRRTSSSRSRTSCSRKSWIGCRPSAKLNDDWTKITAAAAGMPYETTPVRVIVRDISDVGHANADRQQGQRRRPGRRPGRDRRRRGARRPDRIRRRHRFDHPAHQRPHGRRRRQGDQVRRHRHRQGHRSAASSSCRTWT